MPIDLSSGSGRREPAEEVCATLAKAAPGYPHYCEPAFRGWVEGANVAERVAAEVSYLCRILHHRRRVVDLGCGAGNRAIALAKAGYNVIGVDVCEKAIREAHSRAARQGIEIEWNVFDPADGETWPFSGVDAIIFRHGFGAGPNALQLRLLKKLRSKLAENGVLVLGQDSSWQNCGPFASSTEFSSLEPNYDPMTGRISLRATGRGSETSSGFDFRRYTLVELVSLVRSAGFVIERVEGDLQLGDRVTTASNATEIVARRLPSLPASLAVADWGREAPTQLDLRYAPDEAELLDPSPTEFWRQIIQSDAHLGAELAGNYPVNDPYGGKRGADVLSQHFDCVLKPQQVTFAAGVTAFLQCLSGLADGGAIAASELVHGDLETWGLNRGGEVHLVRDRDLPQLREALESRQCTLLHLDRPTFTGQFLPLDELEELIEFASSFDVPVVVDESAAPYPGPANSAVRLANRVNNLVVLRGFTKAYSLGGLRAGFAVCSSALAPRIRELVAPLQVGELALHAALRLLCAGDVFSRLRARIHTVKPAVARLLTRCGLRLIEGNPSLPWVAVANEEGEAQGFFDGRGIRCLVPTLPPIVTGTPQVVRITIPLSDVRVALFNDLLNSPQEKRDHFIEATSSPGPRVGQHREVSR
jgi:histidinol-phosphate/aromatic aminotransferase/cobyric acid decarboxylase-like protein/SAM-dependent methyltransferase